MSSSPFETIASRKPLVVVIAGPTASGKSDVAAEICAAAMGLIVSADSVQAYRKVQIGANKPDAAELARTPHLLVDVADHTQSYNAAEWRRDALFAIQALVGTNDAESETSIDSPWMVQDRQRQVEIMRTIEAARRSKVSSRNSNDDTSFLPVVVGGTMMYLQWLVHGRPDSVRPTEAALQVALHTITAYQAQQDWSGAIQHVSDQGAVYQQQVQKLFPLDWYRIRRILEVALTVKELQQTKEHGDVITSKIEEDIDHMMFSGIRENPLASLGYDVRCFFLCPDNRMKHSKVIDERCEQMIMRGLIQETSDLVLAGEMPEMALKAIGYRQTLDYLQRENPMDQDEEAFADFVAKFTAATRQYSKRQMQWFRRDTEFVFVPVPLDVSDPAERVRQVADNVLRWMSMPREEYDQERLSPTSETAITRSANAAQAKGMRVYQLEKRWLKEGTPELHNAMAEADACTHRFQAKRSRHEPPPAVSISECVR